MGWDAWANKRKQKVEEFRIAAREVKEKAGSVDCLLQAGGLDCRLCAHYLAQATQLQVYCLGWQVDTVKIVAAKAKWPKLTAKNREDWWAILSAKAFLETCAKIESGIKFDF